MNTIYFETHFRTEEPIENWPAEFTIITAYATTGENWPTDRNELADSRLQSELIRRNVWHRRITGFNPDSGHAEPGWAAALTFEDACQLGEDFLQDAIYFVSNGLLAVSKCKEESRRLVSVGHFTERVTETGKGTGGVESTVER